MDISIQRYPNPSSRVSFPFCVDRSQIRARFSFYSNNLISFFPLLAYTFDSSRNFDDQSYILVFRALRLGFELEAIATSVEGFPTPLARGIERYTTTTRTERIGRRRRASDTKEREGRWRGDSGGVAMVAMVAVAFATRWSLSVRALPTLLPGATDPTNDVSTRARCPPHDNHFHLPRPLLHSSTRFPPLLSTLFLFSPTDPLYTSYTPRPHFFRSFDREQDATIRKTICKHFC